MRVLGDNTIGERFKITSFGESHGKVIGVIIDGVPPGLEFNLDFIQTELNRRSPGQSHLVSSRTESDEVKVLSGVFNDKTTGAPICLVVENEDVDSSKYDKFKDYLRPSHADYSALKKYKGFADYRGSGRFSGRITASFVIAGAVAKQILAKKNISIFAYTISIGNIVDETHYSITDLNKFLEVREQSLVRTLDQDKSKLMETLIEEVQKEKDSIGGSIKCIVNGFPEGIGGPVFNSLEANISKAMFAIPAVKGIEFGAGYKATKMKGSEHNDPWAIKNGIIQPSKNDAGGILGGISTGMPIEMTVAFKPTATIGKPQKTVNVKTMKEETVKFEGRHDPCIVPRAVVVVEAMTAVALAEFILIEGFK